MHATPGLWCEAWQVMLAHDHFGPAPVFLNTHNWGASIDANDEPAPGIKPEVGVHIVDTAHGARYIVTVRDRGERPAELVTRWDAPVRGGREGIPWIGDAKLAAIAVAFLRQRAEWIATLSPAELRALDAGMLEDFRHEPAERDHRRPSLEVIAAEARLAIQAGDPLETWFSRAPWQVAPATTRRWIRAAREAGLLPELTGKRGRPRKTPAPDEGNQS